MSAEYDFRRKPNENGDDKVQPLYPRIVSKGTVDSKQLFREISEASTFTVGDLEGMVVALQEKISYYISEGYHVKLGKMGYFSGSLKARPVMDKKEIRSTSISFDNVNFRATPFFKGRCTGTITRAAYGFQESDDLSEKVRMERLNAFLAKNYFITRREYCGITGLLKGKALQELNALVKQGVLRTRGMGSHITYMLADKQLVNE